MTRTELGAVRTIFVDGGAGVFGNTRIMCILGKVSQKIWRELVSTTNVSVRGEEIHLCTTGVRSVG